MKQHIVKLLLSLVPFIAFSETIDISGQLSDEYNRPLKGAVVSLVRNGLSDTTDENGNYRIQGEATGNSSAIASVQQFQAPQMRNGELHFTLSKAKVATISLYSLNGRKIASLLNEKVEAGSWALTPSIPMGVGKGIYVVHARIGDKVYSEKALLTGGTYGGALRKVPAVSPKATLSLEGSRAESFDTLMVNVKGQVMNGGVVESAVATVPPFYIEQRDIYGELRATGWYQGITEIYAAITKEGSDQRQFAELWYNTAGSSYSGFVYFIKSDTVENYSVDVLVYTGERSGCVSTTVDFPSFAGDIEIPDIDISQANWYFTYNLRDTVWSPMGGYYGDTVYMKMNITEERLIRGEIVQYYWDDTDDPETGLPVPGTEYGKDWDDSSDTYYERGLFYRKCGGFMPGMKIRTEFGQEVDYFGPMAIMSPNATMTPLLSEITASIGDTVILEFVGEDPDTIVYYTRSYNNGNENIEDTIYLASPRVKDTISYTIIFPNSIPTNGSFSHHLNMVDLNNGWYRQDITCYVSDSTPYFNTGFYPDTVDSGSSIGLDFSKIHDDGRVIKCEYRLVQSPYDTVTPYIEVTELDSLSIPVPEGVQGWQPIQFRAYDEDGNIGNLSTSTYVKGSGSNADTTTGTVISENLLNGIHVVYSYDHEWNETLVRSGNGADSILVEPPFDSSVYAYSIGLMTQASDFDSLKIVYTSSCSVRVSVSNDSCYYLSSFFEKSPTLTDSSVLVLTKEDLTMSSGSQGIAELSECDYFALYSPEKYLMDETIIVHDFIRYKR